MFFSVRRSSAIDPNAVSVTPIEVSAADWGEPARPTFGTAAPEPGIGETGGFFINTESFELYGPRNQDGSWPEPLAFNEGWTLGNRVPEPGDVDGPDFWVANADLGVGVLTYVWGPRQIVSTSGFNNGDGILYDSETESWVSSGDLVTVNTEVTTTFVWNQQGAFPAEEGLGEIFYGSEPPTGEGSPGLDGDWFWYDDGEGNLDIYYKEGGDWVGPLASNSSPDEPSEDGEEDGFVWIQHDENNFGPWTEDGDIVAIYQWQEDQTGGVSQGDLIVWDGNSWAAESAEQFLSDVQSGLDALAARVPTVKSSVFIEDNSTVTVIDETGVAVKAAGAFEAGPACQSCTYDGNRITYVGQGDGGTRVLASAAVDLNSSANQTFVVELRKNGESVNGARVRVRRFNEIANGSLTAMIDLEPDDFVELWITNLTSGANVTVIDATFTLIN